MATGMNSKINIAIQANLAAGTQTRLQSQLNAIAKRLTLNIGQVKIQNEQFKQAARDAAKSYQDQMNRSMNSSQQQNVRNYEQWWNRALRNQEIRQEAMSQREQQRQQRAVQNYERWWNTALRNQEARQQRAQQLSQRDLVPYNSIKQANVEARLQSQISTAQGKLNPMLSSRLVDQNAVASLRTEFARLGNAIGSVNNVRLNQQWQTEFTRANTQLRELNRGFQEARRNVGGFGAEIGSAAKKMLYWAGIGGVIFGTFNQIKKGIQYIYDLDNALNQIRIVTGQTIPQVYKLADSYNVLAKNMGVTTMEIAKTSVELYRQGLNQKEVEERMKSIIQYAKISNIPLDQANKIITATANATGENVNKIIDIMAILGDKTASGADEVGQALQKVAGVADSMGVSVERASAWIATISSKTRESASTIGNSLNFEALAA